MLFRSRVANVLALLIGWALGWMLLWLLWLLGTLLRLILVVVLLLGCVVLGMQLCVVRVRARSVLLRLECLVFA